MSGYISIVAAGPGTECLIEVGEDDGAGEILRIRQALAGRQQPDPIGFRQRRRPAAQRFWRRLRPGRDQ